MCGRFTLHSPADAVAEIFGVSFREALPPRWNIAPTQRIAIIRLSPSEVRELAFVRWGMGERKLINARSETVRERFSFREAFRFRRCLVVADGFYEWRREGKARIPYYFRRKDDRPFGMAGLWSGGAVTVGDGDACAILTTEASSIVRPIHDRMPMILHEPDFGVWLDPDWKSEDRAQALCRPFEDDELVSYPVSARVNRASVEDSSLIEPLTR